ncbi:MAG: hypothetical protein Q9207_007702 [Kuettlingeria erythrocarpa]
MMDNRVIHAPIHMPSQIIDVGCGTGIVTRHLGDAYPYARVYGVDLSPVPVSTGGSLANVEYILGDVRQLLTSDARLAPGSTDFIFSRLLVMGMTDWAGYVRDMVSLLRPGGWVEMQDFSLEWYLHGSRCSQDWEWLNALFLAAQQEGRDLRAGPNIQAHMRQAGLQDVSMREYRLPIGPWLDKPETKRIGEHAAREHTKVYYHVIPKMLHGLGYPKEKIEEFQRMSSVDVASQEGKERKFYVTIGRKP